MLPIDWYTGIRTYNEPELFLNPYRKHLPVYGTWGMENHSTGDSFAGLDRECRGQTTHTVYAGSTYTHEYRKPNWGHVGCGENDSNVTGDITS